MTSTTLLGSIDPPRRPDTEQPYPATPPEGTPSDPVNIPPPAPDVIFPANEPQGIPSTPGPDLPEIPLTPAII